MLSILLSKSIAQISPKKKSWKQIKNPKTDIVVINTSSGLLPNKYTPLMLFMTKGVKIIASIDGYKMSLYGLTKSFL